MWCRGGRPASPRVEDYLHRRYETGGLTARQVQTELGVHLQQLARLLTSADTRRHHDPHGALVAVRFTDLAGYATAARHAYGA